MFSVKSLVVPVGLAIALVGCAQPEAPPEDAAQQTREVAQYSIEDFLGATDYWGASFSSDGSKILVSSDESGIYNAVAIPVDGSDPVALTQSETDSVFAESYFPADERLLFSQDEGGNELDHLFVQELDGTVHDLTPGEGLKRASRAGPRTISTSSSPPTSATSASSTSISTPRTATSGR